MHVSDHSGFHYRQFLLKALLAELSQVQQSNQGGSVDEPNADAISQLFHDEIELCTDLIESYPGHETLWCHRWGGIWHTIDTTCIQTAEPITFMHFYIRIHIHYFY